MYSNLPPVVLTVRFTSCSFQQSPTRAVMAASIASSWASVMCSWSYDTPRNFGMMAIHDASIWPARVSSSWSLASLRVKSSPVLSMSSASESSETSPPSPGGVCTLPFSPGGGSVL